METLDAIRTRRSVRRYLPDPVDESTLHSLLEAAMQAPSAANEQPWHFVVIDDRSMLDAIPTFSPYARPVRGAPLGILVCADTRSLVLPGFWIQDCSAAIENLLLAKDFSECVAFVSADGVTLAVPAPAEGLSAADYFNFEVDDIDVDTATGWSVLVHGVAADHDGSAQPVLPAPWAPDHSGLTIVITPSTYSGRAVSAAGERN